MSANLIATHFFLLQNHTPYTAGAALEILSLRAEYERSQYITSPKTFIFRRQGA